MQEQVGRYEKTEAGRREIAARSGALSRASRALLIMVDGQATAEELAARAGQLGLDAGAVLALAHAGLIQRAAESSSTQVAQPQPAPQPEAPKPAAPARKRSLAAARMYLMDIAARTFSSAEHPIRVRLAEATDRAAVEGAFEALLAALREATTPTMVAQVETSFRDFLPVGEAASVPG